MERVSRRKMLASASGGVALASALVGAGAVSAQVTRPPGQPLLEWIERYALVLNIQGGDSLRTATGTVAPTGPGYWTGALYADGDVGADGRPVASARQLGTYRSFVWVYGPGVMPQFTGIHSIDIAGRGQISASGVTDISVAITGGTGEFQGARGEIRAANLGTTGTALTLEIEAIAATPGR